jgi:16S rRNA C967 or C1407 C5-methylase (RsmB/RsmF family)
MSPRKASKEVISIAIEALSWIELESSETTVSAVAKAASQFNVENPLVLRSARNLISQVIKRRNLLDGMLDHTLAPASLEDFELGVQAFLRLFIYLTQIAPEKADPVRLAEQGRFILGWKTLAAAEATFGRVNALDISETLRSSWNDRKVALQTFMPEWYVAYINRLFGRSAAFPVLAPSCRPRIFFRLNILKTNEARVSNDLSAKGIHTEPVSPLRYLYAADGSKQGLQDELSKGYLRLQDLPSSLAGWIGKPEPGMEVLIAGAYPATVPAYVAHLMANQGSVKVFDVSKERLRRVEEDSITAGVSIVHTKEHADNATLDETGRLVVVSAPNSRSGVFWREPTLKWRVTEETLLYFQGLQKEMLEFWAGRVEEGGTLVYLTRSIAVEEDEVVVESFMRRHPEFALVDSPNLGIEGLRGQRQSRRFFPHLQQCDGAYVACLTKR